MNERNSQSRVYGSSTSVSQQNVDIEHLIKAGYPGEWRSYYSGNKIVDEAKGSGNMCLWN